MNLRSYLILAASVLVFAGCAAPKMASVPSKPTQIYQNKPMSFGLCQDCQTPTIKTLEQVEHKQPVVAPLPVAAPQAPTAVLEKKPIQEVKTGHALKLDTSFASATRIIPFAYSLDKPGPLARRAVKEMVGLAHQAQRINIQGVTDASGDMLLNQKLARSRAVSIKDLFVTEGVSPTKLYVDSCTDCYIAGNEDDTGRRKNRRVDVQFIAAAEVLKKLNPNLYAVHEPPIQLRSAHLLINKSAPLLATKQP